MFLKVCSQVSLKEFLFYFIFELKIHLFLNTLASQLMKEDEEQSVQRQVNVGHKELHIKCE